VTPIARRYVRTWCQTALYAATLFTRGYSLANDTQQIRVVNEINDQPVGIGLLLLIGTIY